MLKVRFRGRDRGSDRGSDGYKNQDKDRYSNI